MVDNHFSELDRIEQIRQNFTLFQYKDLDSLVIEEKQKNLGCCYTTEYRKHPGYIFKYLIYSSSGYEDADYNAELLQDILEHKVKDFFTKIPTDKLWTKDFTITIGDTKYVVKVQKFTVDTSKLIHKNIKDTVTPEEEEKDIKNLQKDYTYFGNLIFDRFFTNSQNIDIKEISTKLMEEVDDNYQGDFVSEFTVTEKEYGNTKSLIINSTNDTIQYEHNIYAPHSKLNTSSNTYSSVLFVPTNLFNKRDKVADNKVRSSVLSVPKYVDFQSIDINEADSSEPKRDKILYCIEQTFVENVGTLTEEQKKENEINYNTAVKKVEDTLDIVDLLMKDLAILAQNSPEFSKKVKEFTKQKLLILTKELSDAGLKIHIYDNTPKVIGVQEQNRLVQWMLNPINSFSIPINKNNIPRTQMPLIDTIDRNIHHENFTHSFIKHEIIKHIQNNTPTKFNKNNINTLQINSPKILDLYKKVVIMSCEELITYIQESKNNNNNLFITKEIELPDGSKVRVYFYFKNNLPKQIVEPCNTNGVQYGLEYKDTIIRLMKEITPEIENASWKLKVNHEKLKDLKEKHRDKLLEQYLFSAESRSIPKINVHNLSDREYKQINESAAFHYRRCKFTMPKENDKDQVRPIDFEIVIENPNYKDKT